MNAIRTIFKTYLGTIIIGYIYLWLIHEKFQQQEIGIIMIVMLIANLVLTVAYVIGILVPFGLLFKPSITSSTFKEALNKYLIYFSLFPMLAICFCIGLGLQNLKDGIQFSMILINPVCIIYSGLIHFLKYQTIK